MTLESTGEYKKYYRLVESYRTNDTVRHRTIIQLGSLEELDHVEQIRMLGLRIAALVKESRTGMKDLFADDDKIVEALAHKYFSIIKTKSRLDISRDSNRQNIDTDTIQNKDIRETGSEWMCMQALEQLRMADFLLSQGWDQQMVNLALTHIISRACYPASEFRTTNWIKENSAVCELTGYNQDLITKDKLYTISKKLYEVSPQLEQHLSKKTNELFDIHDNIIIYDLTNTYYEGRQQHSVLAQYGRSKEKRKDCKLIVLGVVINPEGFIKYSQLFEGNMTDSKSLLRIIRQLSECSSTTDRKPVVVMDAGIATKENIKLLRSYKFDYMCVSRSSLLKYTVDTNHDPIEITDKKKQPITIQKVQVADDTDNYLLVHSQAKQAKEMSMKNRFSGKYEEELTRINISLQKKGGIKKQEKVWERIGRLKQTYPSCNKHYEIQVIADQKGVATKIEWQQKPQPAREGKYFLRTNLNQQDEQTQWLIYNTIREIESTFRTLKTDLDLRPIFHKTDEASMAHLHLGLLAYTTVNTIRYQLKKKGIVNEWSDIVRIMNTQKMVTTTMINEYDQKIIIRQCSEPGDHVQKIYNALEYKSKPFGRRKFVVPPKPPSPN